MANQDECFFPDVPPIRPGIIVDSVPEPDSSSTDVINLNPRRKRTQTPQPEGGVTFFYPQQGGGVIEKTMPKLNTDLVKKLHAEKPYYPFPLISPVAVASPQEGMRFDIITTLQATHCNFLLRTNNGEHVPVESLRAKFILLCCTFAPCPWGDDAVAFLVKALSLLSFELSTSNSNVRVSFEIVLVVKMRQGWLDDEVAFNHFVSGFSCLVVPFSKPTSRDYICMALDFVGYYKGLLLDPNATVLRNRIGFVKDVGVIAFPFTDDKINFYTCPSTEGRLLSIEALLTCCFTIQPPLFLRKSDNEEEKICISRLNERLVGLYLCSYGSDILKVDKVNRQCRARGLDFEIVVVYLPFHYHPPQQIFEELASWNISWWVFPFNNSVSRWIRQLLSPYHGDRFVIVGPHGRFLDPYGGLLLNDGGIDAYPFTRNALIERKVRKLRELTLGSLLDERYVSRVDVLGDVVCELISVAELQGRNVLLHLGWSFNYLRLEPLLKWYHQIKAEDPDFEVVFLCLQSDNCRSGNNELMRLPSVPWVVFQCSPCHSKFVAKAFSVMDSCPLRKEMFVAFGRDGKISTIRADVLLHAHGSDAFPFSDEQQLQNDVADLLDTNLRSQDEIW